MSTEPPILTALLVTLIVIDVVAFLSIAGVLIKDVWGTP